LRSAWLRWNTNGRAKTLFASGYRLTLASRTDAEGSLTPVLTIVRPNAPALTLKGATAGHYIRADVGVFRVDARHTGATIFFRSFTGGAHCCMSYELVRPEGAGWRKRHLGSWDDSASPEPQDVDRDGRLELVAGDQRFLYRFDSYAGSVAPPVVYRVVDDRLVDVSSERRYQMAFTSKLDEYKRFCEGDTPNGACAGYVATAARAGRLDKALAELQVRTSSPSVERPEAWVVPEHCGAAASGHGCHDERGTREFQNLNDAVLWFLNDLGYVHSSSGPAR
jgi:hypothetical protein